MNKYELTHKELMQVWREWIILLGWIVILLFFVQSVGIIIHESGHYATGKLFGCDNLSISIARFSFQDSFSNVSGWDSCKTSLVFDDNNARVCNTKTNIISSAGFILSSIIIIPLLFYINSFLKKRYSKVYLPRRLFAIVLLFTIGMIIKSASYDLFKIGECLYSTQTGNIILRLIDKIPNILTLLIIALFIIELIKVLFIFMSERKNKKPSPEGEVKV